jgi:hypothetical protein
VIKAPVRKVICHVIIMQGAVPSDIEVVREATQETARRLVRVMVGAARPQPSEAATAVASIPAGHRLVRDVVAAPGAGAGVAVVDRHWGVVAVDRGLIRQGLGA